jgi:hypothetical protein
VLLKDTEANGIALFVAQGVERVANGLLTLTRRVESQDRRQLLSGGWPQLAGEPLGRTPHARRTAVMVDQLPTGDRVQPCRSAALAIGTAPIVFLKRRKERLTEKIQRQLRIAGPTSEEPQNRPSVRVVQVDHILAVHHPHHIVDSEELTALRRNSQ